MKGITLVDIFAPYLLEYPVINICLVQEKITYFITDCKSFKIKHDHLPGQRTADSAYLSSILAISTIPNYGFVKRQILLINQFVCTHTYMQYRHNHYYNKVSYHWDYCGVSLKFDSNKMKYPGILFILIYIIVIFVLRTIVV